MEKTLIVYHSVQGNTEYVAETLGKSGDYDVIKVNSDQKLSNNPLVMVPRVFGQMLNRRQFDKRSGKIDISSYDHIIIGSPCWWYDVTPPIKSFLSSHDFTGKKVSLFITHGGDIGQSREKFIDQIGGGNFGGMVDIPFAAKLSETSILGQIKTITH